jgi:hypothetical protein
LDIVCGLEPWDLALRDESHEEAGFFAVYVLKFPTGMPKKVG